MSLPLSYSNTADYLSDTLAFLSEYWWIYNYQNTHILVKNVLSYFPSDWCDYFKDLSNTELNKLPVHELRNCPTSLEKLLTKISTLRPSLNQEEFFEENCNFSPNYGLSEKKRHEIVALAPLINKTCQNCGVSIVIDIGSGLGYLSHYLNFKYGYKVLGIECSKHNVEAAFKNQEKFYPKSRTEVQFRKHYINSDSSATIAGLLQSVFNFNEPKSVSLIGLHACADLGLNILDVFSKLDFLKCLVIMPCCYHRIEAEHKTENEEHFLNFPKSNILKSLFREYEAHTFLKTPFLRLSCQQAIGSFVTMSKEEHERHSRNLMFRCILQKVAESENCNVKRLKRKANAVSSQEDEESFEIYLKNLPNAHRLTPFNSKDEEIDINNIFLEKMRNEWAQCKGNCYLIEVLTGLQSAIQSICENVILLDQVEYLKEKGHQCRIEKVTDDILSPRCHALIATKN